MAALIAATRKWVEQPFTSNQDLFHWFLIVGVVVISAGLWATMLNRFRE